MNNFTFHRLLDRPELFVRQINDPQYLFQVLEFESEAQLVEAVAKMQDRVVRILPHLVCLRFAGNLVHVPVGQNNYKEVLADIDRVRTEAAMWVKEAIRQKTLPRPSTKEGSR